MAIHQVKTFKVVEAASDGSGCGTILASFKGPEGETLATEEAERLARMNAPTRFYVFEALSGVYQDTRGNLSRRDYTAE